MSPFADGMVWRLRIAAALLCLVVPQAAQAHDARPLTAVIQETAPLQYSVRLRVPPTVERDNLPSLQLPAGCALQGAAGGVATVHAGLPAFVRCDLSLDGALLAVRWPLYNPSLTSVLRYEPQGSPLRVAVFTPDRLALQVPATPDATTVIRAYLRDGVQHIWSGIDHLLFVAGLLLIAGTRRRILLGVSGFTLAHSVTLTLATLGILSPPVEPTEAAIALSIVFLARELLRDKKDTLAWRHPVAVASVFGLLHGLGFAAALQEDGLPSGHVAAALLSFNLGVEIGQLAFIATALALWGIVRRWRSTKLPEWLTATTVGGYGIGIPAMFWLLQRCAALFGA